MTARRNLQELEAGTFLTPARAVHLKELYVQCGQSVHELCKEAYQFHAKFFKNGRYDTRFLRWYEENELNEVFGQESSFSKFAYAGQLLTRLEDQDGFDMARLPAAKEPLYQLWQLGEEALKPLLAEKSDANGSLVISPNLTGQQIERYRKQLKRSRQGSNGDSDLPGESVVVAKITVDKKMLVRVAKEEPAQLSTMLEAVTTALKPFIFASMETVLQGRRAAKKA